MEFPSSVGSSNEKLTYTILNFKTFLNAVFTLQFANVYQCNSQTQNRFFEKTFIVQSFIVLNRFICPILLPLLTATFSISGKPKPIFL